MKGILPSIPAMKTEMQAAGNAVKTEMQAAGNAAMKTEAGETLTSYSQAAYKVFVSVQVIALMVVAGLAASLLYKVQHAASTTNQQWTMDTNVCSNCTEPRSCRTCSGDSCRRCDMELTYPLNVVDKTGTIDGADPGDMIVSKADSQGMSSCQLHFNVNLNLGWGKKKHVASKVGINSGVSASAQVASASINAKSVCPTAADFDGDCSYLSAQAWDVKLDEGKFYSTTLFGLASGFMPFWFLMKLISSEPQLVDFVMGKLSCGRMNTKGRSDKLLIDSGFLGSSYKGKAVEMALKEFSKYFRFKVASNTLMWPITTLASVEKCPAHLFTELPGLFFYYILSACAIFDLVYTIVFYVCFAGADKVAGGRKWLLYAPMFCSTIAALVGFLVVLAKSSWSIVFGFNISFRFNFEVSAQLGTFFVFYLLLSLLELATTMVNISRNLLKMEDEARVAPSLEQP
jgi:hypothetical protein